LGPRGSKHNEALEFQNEELPRFALRTKYSRGGYIKEDEMSAESGT
jgi:hypothetical protein